MSGQCNLDRTSWSNKHFRDFRTIKSWSANSKGSCCRGLKIQLCTVCHYGERKNVRLVIFSRVRFKKRRENTYNNCIGDVRTGFHRHCGNIKSTSPSGMTKQNSRTSRQKERQMKPGSRVSSDLRSCAFILFIRARAKG